MRVIAGRYKGRHLKAPSWEGLRPTSDKVRETLFNILAPRVARARVLDGYAGTGAIGIAIAAVAVRPPHSAAAPTSRLILFMRFLPGCASNARHWRKVCSIS